MPDAAAAAARSDGTAAVVAGNEATSSSSTPPPPAIKFVPFKSTPEPSFWLGLHSHKLHVLKLDESTPVNVEGTFDGTNLSSRRVVGAGGGGAAAGAGGLMTLGGRVRLDRNSLLIRDDDGGDGEEDNAERNSSPASGSGAIGPRNELLSMSGTMTVCNTIESFKKMDKNAFLDGSALEHMLPCLLPPDGEGDGEGEVAEKEKEDDDIDDDPARDLIRLHALSYLDLKKHKAVYWFGFPALSTKPGRPVRYAPTTLPSSGRRAAQLRLNDAWDTESCRSLHRAFRRMRIEALLKERQLRRQQRSQGGGGCPPYFLVLHAPSTASSPPSDEEEVMNGPQKIECVPLTCQSYRRAALNDRGGSLVFAFVDPTTTEGGQRGVENDPGHGEEEEPLHPVGWTLRNLIAYLTLKLELGGKTIDIVSYRPKPESLRRIDNLDQYLENDEKEGEDADVAVGVEDDRSLLLRVTLPSPDDYLWPEEEEKEREAAEKETEDTSQSKWRQRRYRCVGWELNARSRPGPRSVDLSTLLDPSHLVREAIDLNLNLMKWRLIPDLNLTDLKNMRILILGAGTLGCAVARTLLGWGVRRFTFVDNGKVSYSNPVRQSLFELKDCADGGRSKAVAAAEALKSIAGPDVESSGVVLTIPMPGHPFGGPNEEKAVRDDVDRLHQLLDRCDAAFLLTDTRESRWLPTVAACATGTTLIDAALGLDGWLVMRHGHSPDDADKHGNDGGSSGGGKGEQQPNRLGCYFCNDVVAPENSTRDRTLDQQCTVTRPGLAPIAASMAAELLVALRHHPLGDRAPAPRSSSVLPAAFTPNVVDDDDGGGGGARPSSSSPLGTVPHQIRGSLVSYTMMTPSVPAFRCCTGCSQGVVDAYREDRFDLVRRVCCDADGSYLEGLTGLTEFREEAAAKMEDCCLDWDEDEEEVAGGDEGVDDF